MALLSQLDRQLPLGITDSGKLLSAEEVVARKLRGEKSARDLSELPRQALRTLVLARLEKKDRYDLVQFGGGTVSKEEAVHAVEDETPLGKLVEDLERREMRIVEKRLTEELTSSMTPTKFSAG